MNAKDEDELDEQEAEERMGRFVTLRLDEVKVDERKNVRKRPYSAQEIEARAKVLACQPLLHPPTVFECRDGGFELVTGYGRFLALRHLGRQESAFRLIDEPGRLTRLLLMGAENLVRKEMSAAERVEYVWRLVSLEGVSVEEVATHLGLSARYVRTLVGIRRDACPELLRAFAEDEIPIRQMQGLVPQPRDEQMRRLRDGQRWHCRAESIEQGYVMYSGSAECNEEARFLEDDGFLNAYEEGSLPSFSSQKPRERVRPAVSRSRSPSVREHRQMLDALSEVKDVDARLLEGMRRVFRWAVFGEDIPELPATALRRSRRNERRRERRAERALNEGVVDRQSVEPPFSEMS